MFSVAFYLTIVIKALQLKDS